MCGIIGYIGPRPVVPIILDGLKRLEYRGYDSAGIAVVKDGVMEGRQHNTAREQLPHPVPPPDQSEENDRGNDE